jgi:hypothetical protein
MTDDQIIEMAKRLGWNVEHTQTNRMLVLFARDIEDQVRYQEREACAKVAGDWDKTHPTTNYGACIAAAIRARGQA